MNVTGVKPSVKGYLRTRHVLLHPVFIIMQLFIGIWVNYKVEVLEKLHVSFVLFELFADLGASVVLLSSYFTVWKDQEFFMKGNLWHILLAVSSGAIGVAGSQLVFCVGLSNSESAAATAP